VLPGTIQLPPSGEPIVLLADAQTLGGYPQIGHVIEADLPRLAQRRPGSAVRFELCTIADAHRLLQSRERKLALLRYAIGLKVKDEPHRHQL
jgi:antagonist of KipI